MPVTFEKSYVDLMHRGVGPKIKSACVKTCLMTKATLDAGVKQKLGSFRSAVPSLLRDEGFEILHWHIFFADGSNIGFGPKSGTGVARYVDGPSALFSYRVGAAEIVASTFMHELPYSDDIIRAAVLNSFRKSPHYSILGIPSLPMFADNCMRFVQRVEKVLPRMRKGLPSFKGVVDVEQFNGRRRVSWRKGTPADEL